MEDKQLRLNILYELYYDIKLGRSFEYINHRKGFENIESTQMNFAFMWLATHGLMDDHHGTVTAGTIYSQSNITGDGVDIVENLIENIENDFHSFDTLTVIEQFNEILVIIAGDPEKLQKIWELFQKLLGY